MDEKNIVDFGTSHSQSAQHLLKKKKKTQRVSKERLMGCLKY